MKRYRIIHSTQYNFFEPVELRQHTLRLRPREGHELRIETSKLDIFPAANLRWHRDVEGNTVSIASFTGRTKMLTINSDILIQQYNLAPLDFLVSDYAVTYPFTYLLEDSILLAPYLAREQFVKNTLAGTFLKTLSGQEVGMQTVTLLLKLNQYINESIAYRIREEEGVQSAEYTLSCASGSCRDSANLFLVIARQLGFAARFVSGYLYSNFISNQSGSTHAWAEVFIPGAGWKGFDPSGGVIVGSQHISVAVARTPESVPPVSGVFVGNSDTTMQVDVWVSDVS